MMQHEFEALAGYEVSTEDYDNIIEPMYMAVNLSKQEFVKTINKKRFALKPVGAIKKEMKKLAESLEETCTHYTDYETEEKLTGLIKEYINRHGWTADFMINYAMKQSCHYPTDVVIYSKKTYSTIEKINF